MMADMNLNRFWKIIHNAEDDPAKLADHLNTLTRREIWLFYEIFTLERNRQRQPDQSSNIGVVRSRLTPPYADDLAPFAQLVYQTFVERCYSKDEKGSAAYPDAVITDWTWHIIHQAAKDRSKLRQILWRLSKEECYRFCDEFRMAAGALDDERFQPPPELAHSEDGMINLGNWIVTQGRAYYLNVWENPETFPHEFGHDRKQRDFFFMEAEPSEVFEEKFGEDVDWTRYRFFYSFP